MEDEHINVRIYITTNYDKFIFLQENREVKGNTVLNSINKKNLLMDNPILVSPNMEVLDGQNRLIAAKIKKVPVYYRIAQVTTREDISILQNQKAWVMKDYAHFYGLVESKEDSNYAFINAISEKYGLPLHFVINCCDARKDCYQKFKNGEIQLKQDLKELSAQFEKFSELVAIIKTLLSVCKKNYAITHKFKRALWNFMRRKDYSHTRLMHAFQTYPDHLIELLTINSEQLIFQGLDKRIFNYNRKSKRTQEQQQLD